MSLFHQGIHLQTAHLLLQNPERCMENHRAGI